MALQGDIVKKYLVEFPNAQTKTLARKIYKENSQLFSNLEAARTLVRRYRGASGKKERNKVSDKTYFREHQTGGEGTFPSLPKGLTTLDDWDIVRIRGDYRILLLSDVHVPYHDKNALEIAVKRGKKFDANMIILNGDWLDFFSVSRWEKDPRLRDFPKEVKMAHTSFEWIRAQFPKAVIIFKVGNHEERFDRYMQIKAPELLGIDLFELPNVLKLPDYGIEYVTDKKPIKLNELFVIHGHEYVFSISNPVNPARGLYLRSKVNAICGHFHQTSSHSENNMEDKFTSTWSTGCLCDMHPNYMPLNKWNHGFAVVETSGTKFFQVNNYKIIDSEIYNA